MKTIAMILGALLLTYWGALLYSQISEAIDGIKRHGLKQYLSDGQWVVVAATIVALVGALIGGGVGFIFGGLGGMILGIFVGVILESAELF